MMNGLLPRLVCVQTLIRTVRQGSYGNLALSAAVKQLGDPRDQRLCHALFMGTLERLVTLDACIAAHSGRPPEKLDTEVLCVLRCGICELLTMHTPESAAVNLWTESVKKLRKTSAAGMVNAVLRSFLRGGKEIPLPEDPLLAMSVQYSVPLPLVQRLTDDLGAEAAAAFLTDSLGEPPLYFRQNPLRCDAAELQAQTGLRPVPEIPYAFQGDRSVRETTGAALSEASVFADGWVHVQDLASQLCCLALDAQPGDTVLDVCAAPGGKTFAVAEMMQNRGRLLAYDLHPQRVRLIETGAKRLGLTLISAQTGDARHPAADRPAADRVLCDVPCSGFGVMRRKPEVRYKSLQEVAGLPALQTEILEASAKSVREGGVLVYSTCTVLKAENEAVVSRFLAAHPEFSAEPPFAAYPAIAEKTGGQTLTTLLPQMLGTDGFFIAKLRRNPAK